MRKFLLLTTLAAAAVVAAGITVQAQTYGPGMMGNDQSNGSHRGSGYGMMDGNGNALRFYDGLWLRSRHDGQWVRRWRR